MTYEMVISITVDFSIISAENQSKSSLQLGTVPLVTVGELSAQVF